MSNAPGATVSPSNPWLSRPVVVDEIVAEIRSVATYHLRFRNQADAASYRFRPGQFNMLYIPGAGEAPISLSGAPRPGGAGAHTIRLAGNVTRGIFRLAVGDSFGLRGPYGSYWPLDEIHGADVVIVAGGIGLAPLRSAIDEIIANRSCYGQVSLLCGAREPDSLLFSRQFTNWTNHGVVVHTTVDRASEGWKGEVGAVTLLLDRLPLRSSETTVILSCGPEVMMKYVARTAMQRGIVPQNIWCSMERNMQCAVGLCGHCQWGPEFICKDGPVLRYDRLIPLLSVERL